ncbi:MAG: putative Ig domain-containing protein [Synergistaceae bacterium]|nr:putative Ig domain-containing protein [Synergistaceae bacterium]
MLRRNGEIYSFSVIATNAKGSDDVKVSVTVYTAPVLSDDAEIKAVKGSAMSQTFPAVSGNHLVWTLSGDVPAGLSVSSDDDSFTVSGIPTTAGDYSFTLTASNMAGSDDIAVSVIVYEAPLLPDNIVTVEAVKDMSITETKVSASAGNHLTWSVRGNIPAGLTVHSEDNSVTATIMGTPTTAGDYDFSIIASNYAGSADIEVNAIVYEAPEISGSAVELQAVEGRAFSAREISVNSGNHLTWTRTGTFPDGLTFSGNDSALSISGTPSANSAGDYESVFTASNLAGSAKFTATITVYAPPALSDTAITINAVEGEAITTRAITATAGNHIEWTSSGTLPGGLAITSNDSEFTVSGIPSAGSRGSYTFTVTARNYAGSSSAEIVAVVGAKNYSLDVAEASTLATVLSGLTEYELQTIETLKLNGHVTDISSIDALPNLMALDLTEATSLVSVDLSSNDTLLSLDISGNNTIRTLDISGSSLEEVYARECASLETIDAVNCANLKILLCPSSKISSLNLEGSNNLETLNFSENALRKFDVRSFTSLTSLDCNGQAITDYTLRASFDVWGFIGSANSEVENMNDLKGYDDSGVEIPCDYASDTGIATFAKVPYKITYSYMVSDDASMDVTISGGVELRSPVIMSKDIRIMSTEGTAIIPATITASPADYLTWTTSGNLPGGLTGTAGRNAESFTISGTPLRGTAGNYTYTVIASNAVGSDDVVITVTVTAPSPIVELLPPVLSGQSFSINAREGTEITALTITASSDSNISWTSSGTLPDGLTGRANSDGMSFTVSGIPSQGTAGNYAYTVTAMNSGGETSATINITVSATINSQETSSLNDALDNLTSEEASQMTSLAIGDNISDLNGLERLTNLENLDLTEANSLTEVDLSGNTSVKSVDLSGNSSITTLNLGNSNVESVNAEGSESLEEVNIEGNTSIKELNVNSTEISGLNARGCENLEVLKCSSCQITRLELEGCMNLRHLDFAGNAMRRFRATGLNNLMELSCGGQRVEVISFSLVFNLLDFLTASEASGIFEADAGDDNVKNVKGYDASGNEIAASYNRATGEVTFSQAPSKVTYDYDTGFGSDYMDVTISSSGEGSSPNLGTSNGGCGVFPSSVMLLCLTLIAIFAVKKQ